MNSYYLTLVLKPDLEDKARQELLDDVKKKVISPSTSSGQVGKVIREDMWGARDLAYPIKHQTRGYYIHFEFETDPQVAKGLDKSLQVEEDIIRFLLVRNEAKKQNSKLVKSDSKAKTKKDNGEESTA